MKFFLSRIAFSLLVIFALCSFCFFLIHLVPGDPTDFLLGEQASFQQREVLKASLGLDQSLFIQYKAFLKNTFTLNLGRSIYSQKQVTKELWEHFLPTFYLALLSLFLACLWGVPCGVLAVFYYQKTWDHILSVVSSLGISLPAFFLAPLLIWFFVLFVPEWQLVGREDFWAILLPSLSLAFPLGSVLLKMTKASMVELLQEDFIRTAFSKGLSLKKIYFKHILKNALIPIVTILSLQLGALLTGVVIIEVIFDWPGLGTLLFESLSKRDYPLIQYAIVLISVIFVLVNVFADVLYSILNPKVSFDKDF